MNFVSRGEIFFFFGAVDDIGILYPQQYPVGRDDHHFQLVNLVEFGCFGFRSAGHSRELLVHAEIILEGDGGKGLVLALDFDVFLGFNCLMQPIGPASAGHKTTGELVNNDDFASFHHIFDITVIESVRLDGGLDVMLESPILRVGNVADT